MCGRERVVQAVRGEPLDGLRVRGYCLPFVVRPVLRQAQDERGKVRAWVGADAPTHPTPFDTLGTTGYYYPFVVSLSNHEREGAGLRERGDVGAGWSIRSRLRSQEI
jgi:hypothetical protein